MTKLFASTGAVAALALATTAPAQPLGSSVVPTVDNPNRFAVTGTSAAARFFHLARTRRVDVGIIADSNGRLGASGSGHEDAMARAFASRFGMYASRVNPGRNQEMWGTTTCSEVSTRTPPFVAPANPAPTSFSVGVGFPSTAGMLPAGQTLDPGYNVGLTLYADHPVDISGNLRYHVTHSLFGPDSTGVLYLTCREAWPGSAWHEYTASPPISTAGPVGPRDDQMDIAAGPRTQHGINIVPASLNGWVGSTGPIEVLWERAENLDRASGIGFSPLWIAGGRSARYTLFALQSTNPVAAMTEWYRQATRLQNGPPVLLVQILHGGNDIIDYNPSLGPAQAPSNTPEGHRDNIRGIINLLRSWWTASGRDPANLFFELGPYHPRPGADRYAQLGFEQVWRDLASLDPQVFAVCGNMLSTADEFLTRGLLINSTDTAHLSYTGYQTWARTTLTALGSAICPGDFDQNAELSINDLLTFFNAWIAQDRRTDFDYSGQLDTQDIFDFINAWFASC